MNEIIVAETIGMMLAKTDITAETAARYRDVPGSATDVLVAVLHRIKGHLAAIREGLVERPAVLTVEQAAKRLNASEKTIMRAITQGHLKAGDISERTMGPKHRSNYRIRQEWLDEYLQAKATNPPPVKTRRKSRRLSEPTEFVK